MYCIILNYKPRTKRHGANVALLARFWVLCIISHFLHINWIWGKKCDNCSFAFSPLSVYFLDFIYNMFLSSFLEKK